MTKKDNEEKPICSSEFEPLIIKTDLLVPCFTRPKAWWVECFKLLKYNFYERQCSYIKNISLRRTCNFKIIFLRNFSRAQLFDSTCQIVLEIYYDMTQYNETFMALLT